VAVAGKVMSGRQKDHFVGPDQAVAPAGQDGYSAQVDPYVAAVPQILPVQRAVDFMSVAQVVVSRTRAVSAGMSVTVAVSVSAGHVLVMMPVVTMAVIVSVTPVIVMASVTVKSPVFPASVLVPLLVSVPVPVTVLMMPVLP